MAGAMTHFLDTSEKRIVKTIPLLSDPGCVLHRVRAAARVAGRLLSSLALLLSGASVHAEALGTAFFYGAPVPVEQLSRYKWVVVEADNLGSPARLAASGALVFAYVSVGEAEGWRASTRALDNSLFDGANSAWGSRVADLTQPGWSKFLLETRMAGLWKQGYRAFFLDTLDSYQLTAKDPAARLRQQRALVALIEAMHRRFPGVQLLLNRGFEVLPDVSTLVVGVAAESLYQSWDPKMGAYTTVDEPSREWLLARLREVQQRFGLPVTVIDYVPKKDSALARATAQRITDAGFTPWIATPQLDTIAETNLP
jgi:uncharacterized protein (TIGR01370 family)